MPFNSLSIALDATPSAFSTYVSHYFNRAPLKEKPTAHISYHEGLKLIRQFLDYSSRHTVEDLQQFTAQWVPCPYWVRLNDAEVVPKFQERAAALIQSQLGRRGIEKVGGRTWWQWRRPESPLRAEWIEMKKEYTERKRTGAKCERVILYVHGGAYYFGSVDEHRYQLQRHARKLKAQVLAPRYRLAPQFPFPCGLYDCLATYFYLLEHFRPSQILFAGDSAGGGMVLSLLVTLRDQGQPLPAGTILLSPWVDLTHSFPSVAGDGEGDYIPPHGFHHKPSMAWPPPPVDEVKKASGAYGVPSDAVELPAMMDAEVQTPTKKKSNPAAEQRPTFGPNQGIYLDGKVIEMKEQVQMYTTNELLAHPLVSPVMHPTLGGLPPMLIQVGGAELLRDEQIYIAHKAANPKAFLPVDEILDKHDPLRREIERYPPTDVQLQVWDDLCHVPHTLSFTRPAKYMYRSVAQFGAWALAHAQQRGIDIPDDDAVSFISSNEGDDDSSTGKKDVESSTLDFEAKSKEYVHGAVSKAGDPLPPFKDHMIRQRVTRHGVIYPLKPPSEMQCLAVDPATIGTIKPGPVRKWLAAKNISDTRFGADRKKIDKKRAKEFKTGYDEIPGECPPPTAVVGRRLKGVAPEEKKRGKSWGLAMWSGWGSSQDEKAQKLDTESASLKKSSTLNVNDAESESRLDRKQTNLTVPGRGKSATSRKKRRISDASKYSGQVPWNNDSPQSRDRRVHDRGQTDDQSSISGLGTPTPATRSLYSRRTSATGSMITSRPVSAGGNSPIPTLSDQHHHVRSRDSQAPMPVPMMSQVSPSSEKILGSENTYLSPSSSRPHNGHQAYPFRLQKPSSNPSLATLDSMHGTPTSAFHSELAGDSPDVAEMGDGIVSKPGTSHGRSSSAVTAIQTTALPSVVSPNKTTSPHSPEMAAPSPIAQAPSTKPSLDTLLSPPTPQREEPFVSPIGTPGDELDREDLGSSFNVSRTELSDLSPEQAANEQSPGLKVHRTPIFDHRTSTLGFIGADGMPTAHHEFPVRNTMLGQRSLGEPSTPPSEPLPPIPNKLSSESTSPTVNGLSPMSADESKTTATKPFKLRNATNDSFEPRTPAFETAPSTPMEMILPEGAPTPPSKSPEQTKLQPFKLRHTVPDPTPNRVNSSDDDGPPMMPAPLSISREKTPSPAPSPALGKEDVPPSYDSSIPRTNVTMPETVSKMVRASPADHKSDDKPPPPPPKDDKPKLAFDRNTVKGKSGKGSGGKVEGLSESNFASAKGAPPMIEELGFEKKGANGR